MFLPMRLKSEGFPDSLIGGLGEPILSSDGPTRSSESHALAWSSRFANQPCIQLLAYLLIRESEIAHQYDLRMAYKRML